MIEKTVAKQKLRNRLFKSIIFGLSFAAVAITGFLNLRQSETDENAIKILRQSFKRNERIGRKLFSKNTLSVTRPKPPKGTKPRVNGMIGLESQIDIAHYRMQIQQEKLEFLVSMEEIYKLPKSEASTDFKCVEGWSEIVHYAGVKFSDFAKFYMIGVNGKNQPYRYVGLETPDEEYYVSIDMDSMLHEQTILAYEMNGMPLSFENGYPIRLIIPTKYGIKSLKRIGRLFFSDTRPPDYWAEQGYDWYSGL